MDSKPKVLREVQKLRGVNSKTYEMDNGQFQLRGWKEAIHYENKLGQLKEIDTNIDVDTVKKTPYVAHLTKDKIGFTLKKKSTKEQVEVRLERLGDKEISYQLPLIERNTAFYEDVDKDIDILIEFNNNGARLFRILKTPEAERKAIFHIKQQKDGFKISPKFFGTDAKGRPLDLKTKPILETDYEIFIEDVFTGKTITVDKKTRVRSLSDEVTYPVKIDPEVRVWS